MRASLIIVLSLLLLIGCTEDDFPQGIYGYQVERLLSGGNEKSWFQVISTGNCADSVQLYVQVAASPDSISVSRIVPLAGCSGFDTVALGNANASTPEESILFSDSLLFANGNFWLIQTITSNNLVIIEDAVPLAYLNFDRNK